MKMYTNAVKYIETVEVKIYRCPECYEMMSILKEARLYPNYCAACGEQIDWFEDSLRRS